MRAFGCLLLGTILLAACGGGEPEAGTDLGAVAGDATATLSNPVGTLAAAGPSYSFQSRPVVAGGRGTFLAVWLDRDAGGRSARVRAARVDGQGNVLGERSIEMPSIGAGEDVDPAVAFDGTSFLVAWSHATATDAVVAAARVATDGTVLDAQPIQLGKNAGKRASLPSVAWNGSEYLVAWSDDRDSNPEVYAARISPGGAPVESPLGFRVSQTGEDAGGGGKTPSVAAAGRTFLVAWDEMGSAMRIRGTRIRDGRSLDTIATTIATGSRHAYTPSVASDGTNFLVAWYDYSASGDSSVRAARVTAAGERLLGDVTIATNEPSRPAVIWDGDAYAVAWAGGAKRLSREGVALLGTTLQGTSGEGELRPAIAWNGSSYLVLRSHSSSNVLPGQPRSIVSGSLYARSGTSPTRSAITVARADAPQRQVVSASDGAGHLVVWQEYRSDWNSPELWGAFAKPDGTLADAKGFLLRAATTKPTKPAVVFDGAQYVVAWEERGDNGALKVATLHVPKTGPGADAPAIVGGSSPSLAAAGNGKVLLLANDRAYWVPASGAIDETRPAFERSEASTWTIGTRAPVVFDGTNFVLAWTAVAGGASTAEVHAQRFSATGQTLDATPRVVGTVNLTMSIPAIAAASDGHGLTLVAWEDRSDGAGAIVGARFESSGAVLGGPVRLDAATAPAKAYAPSVVFDGHNWVVAYETREDFVRTESGSGIALARFRFLPAGFDRVGDAIVASPGGGWAPMLAPGATGKALLTYEALGRAFGSPGRAAIRLFDDVPASSVSPPGPGPSSSGAAPPATGDDDDGDTDAPATSSSGSRPKTPTTRPSPTKGASVNPAEGTGAAADDGGCSTAPGRATSGGGLVFVALAALAASVRRRRLP
ncbi:MAG: hypothetical protein KIT84_27935 [Labilithrix sp.]|nr:hypothetical protein [Labilithrix sp.]MCW5814889.1 hypothetical protein [Labilithrix sp.]